MGISVIYSPTSTISYKEEELQKNNNNNTNSKPLSSSSSSPLGLFLGLFLVILAYFFPGFASFNPVISILQTIFTVFLCLSSLSIFHNTGPSMMRRSLKKTASAEGSSAAGKYNRMKNAVVRNISSDEDAMPRSRSMNRSTSNSQDHLLTPPGEGGDSSASTSPYNSDLSPMKKSPWSCHLMNTNPFAPNEDGQSDKEEFSNSNPNPNVLMGSLVREEGHVYSLATHGDLLYTGSDSKNIRVWKNQKEFSGFKSNSGLVKAIVIAGDRIFTGHQDGKIRVWKISSKNPTVHKRVETLPTFKNYIKSSLKPGSYVTEGRKKRNTVWIKHLDAISCLGLSEDKTLLYSASWDKTFKVWKISSSKCLESVTAHDDAVNCLVAGFDGLVFTGSADGTVKVWRRELQGKGTKHFFSQTLLKQECAVTALAVNSDASMVYCGSSDGMVNFWERERHLSHGGVLRGHKLAVLCLVTAGNLVISGSADTGICVWRRLGSDHICLSLLNGHTGPVKCLAAEKDNEPARSGERKWILYSGSLDKSVKMWRVSEHAPPMGLSGTESSNSMPAFLPSAPSFSSQGMVL